MKCILGFTKICQLAQKLQGNLDRRNCVIKNMVTSILQCMNNAIQIHSSPLGCFVMGVASVSNTLKASNNGAPLAILLFF
jgi:hypothetical protein